MIIHETTESKAHADLARVVHSSMRLSGHNDQACHDAAILVSLHGGMIMHSQDDWQFQWWVAPVAFGMVITAFLAGLYAGLLVGSAT